MKKKSKSKAKMKGKGKSQPRDRVAPDQPIALDTDYVPNMQTTGEPLKGKKSAKKK